MDKFTVIFIFFRLRNLKQYPDWLIGLSLRLKVKFYGIAYRSDK